MESKFGSEALHLLDLFAPHFVSLCQAPPWRRYCVPGMRTHLGRSSRSLGVPIHGSIATTERRGMVRPLRGPRNAPCCGFLQNSIGSHSSLMVVVTASSCRVLYLIDTS